ncbi:hypothetical protein [Aeromonas phage phiWae14]|nr:hypothetical protein [Aeromonas phage phiWae14]
MSNNYQDISGPSKEIVLQNFQKLIDGQRFDEKYIPVYVTNVTKIMDKPLVVPRPVVIKSLSDSNDMRSDDKWWRKD